MRGQPAPLSPLTDEQRRFAEEHHGLILAFLGKTGYAAGDYYGAAALGFLQAVQRYLTQPWLRRYTFPTVAWRAMGRGVATQRRTDERQREAEQRYLEMQDIGPPDLCGELSIRLALQDLIAEASEEQRRLALLRLRGFSLPQAAQAQGMGIKRARRLLDGLYQNYRKRDQTP